MSQFLSILCPNLTGCSYTIQLEKQTRHGDWQVTVLTNLPEAEVTALVVSELYLQRWEIEKMFQVIATAS